MNRRKMLLAAPLAAAFAGCSGSDNNPFDGSSAAESDELALSPDSEYVGSGAAKRTITPDPLAHIVLQTMSYLYELDLVKVTNSGLELQGRCQCYYTKNITKIGGKLFRGKSLTITGNEAENTNYLFSLFVNLESSSHTFLCAYPEQRKVYYYGYEKLTINYDIIDLLIKHAGDA